MNYLIECRNIDLRSTLSFYNEEEERIADITFNKSSSEYPIEVYNLVTHKKYYCKSNPLRFKKRFIIFDNDKNQLAKVAMGIKIIHSIIEAEKYYFVKAAFWKIKYLVYDGRMVINRLETIRTNHKRFFKISTQNDDFVIVLALYLLARGVRLKSI